MNNKKLSFAMIAGLILGSPVFAGVVYEIEVKDHAQSPPKVESIEMAAEGRHLKMGIGGGSGSRDGEMIFRADRREVVVVDDKNSGYYVIDHALIARLNEHMGGVSGGMDGQLAIARKELHKRLGSMTEEQRRGLEQALGHPKGGAGEIFGRAPVPSEVRRVGERATHGGYPCVRYDVLRGDEKIREIWVTDWNRVEGGASVKKLFGELADFFSELEQGGFSDPDGGLDTYRHFTEVDGFPVVVRNFDDGELEDESILRSARRETIDPDAFEPPAGYKRQEMFGPR